jgi:TRAP-type mannitol/chloroaromatic compound transport system substrate-binding protein
MSAAAARKRTARRRFLLAAGTAGAGLLAMPQISRAQGATQGTTQGTIWRVQSAWPPRDIFHEFAVDYARRVEAMSGGRLRIDMVAGGSVVPPFQAADAVHAGILDGAHGSAALWYHRHRACALFGTPPPFGWDSQSFVAWFYYGGGEALYQELVNGILRLDLIGFLSFPMPAQPLGWFRKDIRSADDLRGVRTRTAGLSAEVFRALGAAVIMLPGSDVAAAIDRGVLDATESNNPSSDLQLGLPEVSKTNMMGGHHHQAAAFEVVFNKRSFDALPAELKAILRHALLSASSDQLWQAHARYAKDFDEIGKRGVSVVKAGPTLLEDQLKAWDQVIAERSKEPFFAKVIASQKEWVKRTQAYIQTNNLDSVALEKAYKHFFG